MFRTNIVCCSGRTVGGLIFQVAAVIITLAIMVVGAMSLFVGFPWPIFVLFGTLVIIQILYWIQGDQTIINMPTEDDHGKFKYERWFL